MFEKKIEIPKKKETEIELARGRIAELEWQIDNQCNYIQTRIENCNKLREYLAKENALVLALENLGRK